MSFKILKTGSSCHFGVSVASIAHFEHSCIRPPPDCASGLCWGCVGCVSGCFAVGGVFWCTAQSLADFGNSWAVRLPMVRTAAMEIA
eukprot:6466382-Amphidinium_carterae.1